MVAAEPGAGGRALGGGGGCGGGGGRLPSRGAGDLNSAIENHTTPLFEQLKRPQPFRSVVNSHTFTTGGRGQREGCRAPAQWLLAS